jgi:DhnA family fructose-bisphosphate aldolase class Ia
METYSFKTEEFLPEELFAKITDIRVEMPEIIEAEAKARKKRAKLTRDGKLTILAADHPARAITKSGDDPLIMGNRFEYLGRILRVITSPEFDGVMGTPDILEDLLIVNYLIKEKGGESFLDEKVMLGCMNRGGLKGAEFEMDDKMTAFTPESIHNLRLDGAKLMVRFDLTNPGSLNTMFYCAEAVNELNALGIPAFIEPLPVTSGDYKVKKEAAEITKIVGIASAIGASSSLTWLKIPYCENYEIVSRATTCPILMLGGESRGDPRPILEEFAKGMKAGPNIRGALVGRNVTFPGPEDPRAVALAVNGIVHKGWSAEEAVKSVKETRGQEMDGLRRYFK